MPIWTEIGQTYDMDRLWTKSGLVTLTSIWSKYKYCSNGQILDKVMTWTDSGQSLDWSHILAYGLSTNIVQMDRYWTKL